MSILYIYILRQPKFKINRNAPVERSAEARVQHLALASAIFRILYIWRILYAKQCQKHEFSWKVHIEYEKL